MKKYKKIVVKVGTSSLTHDNGCINLRFIDRLCATLTDLKNSGHDIILVTSGAIGVGKNRLQFSKTKLSINEKQAMAAIGQGILLHIYEKSFLEYGQISAQLLLTRDDLNDRKRFLTARNTIIELLRLGVVPIINENDSIATDEIKFGDNDTLASLVSVLTESDLTILLTDVDGLYEGNPQLCSCTKKIDVVYQINSDIYDMAGGSLSNVGTGGMKTKIDAASISTNAGIPLVIALGQKPEILYDIVEGKTVGTLFEAKPNILHARKSWILYGSKSDGKLVVDMGAENVLKNQGKSLLPSGILKIEGNFERGSMVEVMNENGKIFAKGITNYSSDMLEKMKGRKTADLAACFNFFNEDEVIHRDNLGLL